MCESCYKADGGTCICDPCLVNQGSNWCTVCAHRGSGPGVPAATDETVYADDGGSWQDEGSEAESETY